MFRSIVATLLSATAIVLPAHGAQAAFKSGGSSHPALAAPPAVMQARASVSGMHVSPPRPSSGMHGHFPHHFHKHGRFHHHRNQFVGWAWPYGDGFYAYYPSDEDASSEAPVAPGYGPYPGQLPARAFYETGCRSEEVSVPGTNGRTRVTVTRCSVPISPQPPLK